MSVDLDKIAFWGKYKEKLLNKLEDAPAFEVDLAFEYKDTRGHIVTFTSGDMLFVTDLKFSKSGGIMIEVPYGPETRFIPIMYADSLSNEHLGVLDELIDDTYDELLRELNDKNAPASIMVFSDKVNTMEVDPLNNATEWIKQTIEAEKDRVTFESIDKFGMF